ncbi:hypothetical protein [Streptomyces sp. 8ZJF_21]|nr:hypothetical protein [Streptomyces sp. 8ZJF_21]MCD9591255.1 hypothetical protein [Streptomyces sp. 8ZJF_21]
MTKSGPYRWLKGACVSAVAAVVCYWLWTSLSEWADGVAGAQQDAMLAGSIESLLAGIAGVVSMPVLLWAGMRVLRERGNHLLVILGAIVWIFAGGHVVEDSVSTVGTAVTLALFAVFGSLLSTVELPGS